MFVLKTKRFLKDLTPLKFTGDWVDLRVADILKPQDLAKTGGLGVYDADTLQTSEFVFAKDTDLLIRHGIALELPAGYEALVRPRGSLFKKTGLIFTTSGVIDEGFNGDHDEWFTTYRATRAGSLNFDARIAQFRIFKKQPELQFEEVMHLGNQDRGGLGSTGGYQTGK